MLFDLLCRVYVIGYYSNYAILDFLLRDCVSFIEFISTLSRFMGRMALTLVKSAIELYFDNYYLHMNILLRKFDSLDFRFYSIFCVKFYVSLAVRFIENNVNYNPRYLVLSISPFCSNYDLCSLISY